MGPVLEADLTIDLDSTICRGFGTAKQGVKFGYTGVRGLHPLLATLAGTDEVVHSRMRGGNAGAAAAPTVSPARPSPGCATRVRPAG